MAHYDQYLGRKSAAVKLVILAIEENMPMAMRPVLALSLAMLWASPAFAAMDSSVEVWKSATCTCCGNWVKHLEANGLLPTVHPAEPGTLAEIKRQAGISSKLASCHTAKIDGYVIEGHVPAPDIKRLVSEHPDAVGLTVPGMPVGAPGMEQGAESEPYDVLLIKKDGTTEVFAHH
jgi:hypothetical protein